MAATSAFGMIPFAGNGKGIVKKAVREVTENYVRQVGKNTLKFGQNSNQISHAFRHTDALGLSRSDVMDGISNHFPSVASSIPSGRPLNSIITVGSVQIQYSAFKLADGTINIGRIHGI